ncbi:MAG: phosphate ABC transporter ATP-binding protein PstB [Bdellovibrionota bacterium]
MKLNTPNPDALVSVRSLNAWFGSKQAVKDVSIDVHRGDVLAIIGPSGCGKSTFVRCLNRLHEEVPSARASGIVEINRRDIYAQGVDPVPLRRNVGMVFQRPNPFPGLSIFDNVASGLKLAGVQDSKSVHEAVEQSLRGAALWEEVKDALGEPGTGLSGGQQQRLCIARALAVEPQVLLMDEPTSALDPVSTEKIEALIDTLRKKVTIIIVTHNLGQARRIATHTAFFYLGNLVEHGLTTQVFTQPEKAQTRDYVQGRFG